MNSTYDRIYRRLEIGGPYAVAFLFVAMAILIRYVDSSWMSGITGNYLPVHVVLEFVGILVSFAIFTVGWATYQNARDADILVLSVASFAVGVLDLGHTLSFTGMPDFVGPSGPNKAIGFWFASRITGSLAFLYIALSRPRVARLRYLQSALLVAAALWIAVCYYLVLWHPDQLPVFFVQGEGLRPVKVQLEWILVGIACGAAVLLSIGAEKRENMSIRWMACASMLYGACGYFFTIYRDFNDVYNFAGHCYKAVAYLLLYRAVFYECVSRPYARVQHLAAEAEASNLSKSRFLANVSHEFRTPLGVIGGFGELLLNSEKLDASLKVWAQTIVRNSKQLSLLIDDLLDLAKAENETVEIRSSTFDLVTMLNQIKESMDSMPARAVAVKVELQLGGAAQITTDELRLRQILINLLGNAMKFTSQGQISITADRWPAKDMIRIRVEDSGIGIASADVGRLFQPFSQVTNPNHRRFGGTGLGLSLSRKLAELLGGDLRLDWSEPGRGSCFSVTFRDQLVTSVSVLPAVVDELPVRPLFEGRKILIAEDSEDNQMLLSSFLAPTKIAITFAGNGRAAVDAALRESFDMVLMDIQMPEMDGFEATAELRRQNWQGPIVALTAHALQPERDRAMKNGFTGYLVKPIKRETLWNAIAQTLN